MSDPRKVALAFEVAECRSAAESPEELGEMLHIISCTSEWRVSEVYSESIRQQLMHSSQEELWAKSGSFYNAEELTDGC